MFAKAGMGYFLFLYLFNKIHPAPYPEKGITIYTNSGIVEAKPRPYLCFIE